MADEATELLGNGEGEEHRQKCCRVSLFSSLLSGGFGSGGSAGVI